MSSPANFNGLCSVIDVNDSVMLLIDHQSGLFSDHRRYANAVITRSRSGIGESGDVGEDAGYYYGVLTASSEWPVELGNPRYNAPHMRSTLHAKEKLTLGITTISSTR